MLKRSLLLAIGGCVLGAGASVPTVGDVEIEQTRDALRTVTVRYSLSEEAIVTVDFQTNTLPKAAGEWVSIGVSNFTNVTGDVNRLVAATDGATRRTLTWPARDVWPERRLREGRFRAVVKAVSTLDPPDYLVIDLTTKSNVWYFTSAEALPWGPVTNRIYKDQFLPMRRVRAKGTVWLLGSTTFCKYVNGIKRTNEDAHRVMLTRDYYMAVYELTQAQHGRFEGTYVDSRLPYGARWCDLRGGSSTVGYNWPTYSADGTFDYETSHQVNPSSTIGRLRSLTGLTGLDLPTEAQWEFACRGSDRCEWALPGELTIVQANLNKVARNSGNQKQPDCEGLENATATVGSYLPNSLGLYDMIGNLCEWCLDWYEGWDICNGGGPLDTSRVIVDPVGPQGSSATNKDARGGTYSVGERYAYITLRSYNYPPADYQYKWGCRLTIDIR